MASKSYNDIRSIAEDWQYDDRNGLKYSGKSVQKFIKGQLQEKVAATYFDAVELRLYGFKSTEDRDKYVETKDTSLIIDSCPFNFTGMQYRVVIDNLMGSTQLYFTTNQSTAIINVGFISQEKGITDFEWKDKIEDFLVSVAVDKGAQGNYVNIKTDETVLNGATLSFDVKNLIISGANRVKVTATGKDTGATTTLVYTVTLTAMYIAPSNFTWYKPYIEGEKFSVGGLNIGGTLSKELVIKVTAENYAPEPIRVPLGTNTYTDLAYSYDGLPFPSNGTGVYNLEIWVDAGGVQTEHLSYNIICVSQADKDKAQLVCIGTIEKSIVNYSDNKYFEYCVYNGGAASGEPTISLDATVNSNSTNIMTETLSVATSTAIAFERSLEIEAEEAQLKLVATMTYGNTQRVVFAVDNSKSYPATTGAVFYLNPSTRSNAQANRETIINAADDTAISAVWTKMAWSDLADGYTVDENERKCLKLPAGSKVNISYKAMNGLYAGVARTIEFVYKVKNASDYNEPCITICDDVDNPNFTGLVIRPKNILLHSNIKNVEDDLQDYKNIDEETVSVVVTFIPNYKTNYGNIAQIYVNGTKVRTFSYSDSDSWIPQSNKGTNGNLALGSDTADLYLYKLRVYNKGFEKADVRRNHTNALPTALDKAAYDAWNQRCLDDNNNLDYQTCVNNGLNTMVIEMLNGSALPNYFNQDSAQCNLHINIHSDMSMIDKEMQSLLKRGDIDNEESWIKNQTIEGQGTTAMTYYRWNFRWKLSSAYNKRRITAKKNFASSMHSHKMGATRMLNYLYEKCVGPNEADADVAVTQFPVYGFLAIKVEGTENEYIYEPIGLYTIGADKGDKHTFGYDKEEFEDSLIHMEGADHDKKGVGFDYPWDALAYDATKDVEALGAVDENGKVVAAFEVGACGQYSTDDKAKEGDIKAMLDQEFKPAYNVIYQNSPFVKGVPETLEQINANPEQWRADRERFEFYTHGVYDLYYYNIQYKKYMPTGINVVEDLGLDITKKTEDDIERMVIEGRKARFAANWGKYWNTKSIVFFYCYLVLIAATDNFKKNMYPQKFKLLADGGKWDLRNDDLDTIWGSDNLGLWSKLYSILVGDATSTGSVFRGDDSALWTLVKETQIEGVEGIKSMMIRIFEAMVDKAVEVGYSGSTRDKLIGCIKHFFWDNAQEYFPSSAYNVDAEWTYESAWIAPQQWAVDPLSQSLGSHYEAERDYVAMRMLFLLSYFNYGPFRPQGYQEEGEGVLESIIADTFTYNITPTVDMTPAIITGQSGLVTAGKRVKAGETVPMTVEGTMGANTRVYIQGLDWYSELGDLCQLRLDEQNSAFNIKAKRLQRLKIGDAVYNNVKSNIKKLTFGECPSLTVVDARNVGSLTGTVNLGELPRLQEAYFGGTDVRDITVPEGAKLVKLQIPSTLSALKLIDLKFLEDFNYDQLALLRKLRVEGCESINVFALLSGAYNAEKSALGSIRITDFVADGNATDMDMLANLVNDKDKDGNDHQYNGIDADDREIDNSNPVIDGTFNATTPTYEDSLEVVRSNYPNLVINESGIYYQRFKDKEVLRVLLENNVGDGLGVVKEDWANVKSVGTWFRSNTDIESFPEFKLSNITSVSGYAFDGCTSLKDIDISNATVIGGAAFSNCSSLSDVKLGDVVSIGNMAFYRCTSLNIDISFPNLTGGITQVFEGSGILSCSIPKVSSLGNYCFSTCKKLTSVDISSVTELKDDVFVNCNNLATVIGSNIKNTGSGVFQNCTSLTSIDIPNVESIGANAFGGCTSLESVDIRKAESLGGYAFYNCTSLSGDFNLQSLTSMGVYAFRNTKITSFVAPNVESIGTLSLSNCTNLVRAELDNIKTIGQQAFEGDTSLTTANIPNVETISANAFDGCTSLESVDIRKAESLGDYAFYNCTSLSGDFNLQSLTSMGVYAFRNTKITSFVAPNVESIGTLSLSNCTNLVRAELDNIKTIGQQAFEGDTSLTTANIPNVETISANAFDGCTSLTGDFDLQQLTSLDAYAFRNTKINSVKMPLVENIGVRAFYNCTSLSGDYNLPNLSSLGADSFRNTGITSFAAPQITEVLNSAFRDCTKLKTFDAANVTLIEAYAFNGCTALTDININNIQRLESAAFYECSSLKGDFNFAELELVKGSVFFNTKITSFIGLKVKTFEYGAFYNCTQLKYVELRDVESFEAQVFQNCIALKTLIIRNSIPPAFVSNVLAGANNTIIYVPDEAVDTYKNTTGWSTYASRIKGISELPTE